MDSRESAFWVRLKANRWAYTLTILPTLAVGILIGTVVSYGVKGKEGQKSSDATPLTVPLAPAAFQRIFTDCQAVGPKRGQHQYGIDHKESAPASRRTESRRRR